MKQSKFYLEVPYHQGYLYYSFYSKSIIYSKSKICESIQFIKNGFYITDDFDEVEESEKLWLEEKNKNTFLNLTIIPTLFCNLNCSYCYEHDLHKETIILNTNVVDGIIAQLNAMSNLKKLHIEWSGGEPLLAPEVIKSISLSVLDYCKKRHIYYTASISTNLTLFNSSTIKLFNECHIHSISTTLVGNEEIHNHLRPAIANENSFIKTINGIQLASQNFNVNICINITSRINEYLYDLSEILHTFNTSKIKLTFLNVVNYGFGEQSIFLPEHKSFKKLLEVAYFFQNKGFSCFINANFGCKRLFCAAQANNAFTIHPNGCIYKCTSSFLEKDKIGYITKEGFQILNTNNFNPYQNKKCKFCKYLLYCNGGCSSLRNEEKKPCPQEIQYLPELLTFYVDSLSK